MEGKTRGGAVKDKNLNVRNTGLRISRPRRESCFSLIELLVVVSVIAVLAGLLLPVLNRARESAHFITCVNNTGTVGKAMLMYVNDHSGFFPAVPVPKDLFDPGASSSGNGRYCPLKDYFEPENQRIGGLQATYRHKLACPVLRETGKFTWGGNRYLVQWDSSKSGFKASRLRYPSRLCVVGEGDDGVIEYYVKQLNPSRSSALNLRHDNRKGNVLFGDMHVNFVTLQTAPAQNNPVDPAFPSMDSNPFWQPRL